ncbi:sugar ABC transporter permease [candidate division BRC1 bacterium HGW-BRC1-1]|jgi:multiple sugar transport system permease protein|nr:MAG: sugar ABC transporter permease [candidate division BRC1 bacterium HGW-BRC1-1]
MNRRSADAIVSVTGHASLLALSIVFALPFAWLVSTSLKPPAQIFSSSPNWLPSPVCWQNYVEAVNTIPFIRYAWNTIFVALTSTFATLFSCSLVAYGFAVVRWRWSRPLFLVMLATVMLPGQVTMIPVFIIFKNLGWVGSYRPLIIPAFFSTAFFVFLLMQFFRTIPRDLIDVARIDGCSHFDIYWRLVLPLSRPALMVVAFFTFTAAWNDFLGPLIYLNDDRMYTLSIGLQQFVSQHAAEWHLLMAASTIMIVPVILLFLFMQKTFVEGIHLSGLKA